MTHKKAADLVARHKQELQEIDADHNGLLDKALARIREEYEDLLSIERYLFFFLNMFLLFL